MRTWRMPWTWKRGGRPRVAAAYEHLPERPGDMIRRLRSALGMTQMELARELRVTWTAISRWERHLALPLPVCFGALERLARDRGVDGILPVLAYVPMETHNGPSPQQLAVTDYPPSDAHLRVRAMRAALGLRTHAALAAAIGCGLRDAWRWEEPNGVNTVTTWLRLRTFAAERGVAHILEESPDHGVTAPA